MRHLYKLIGFDNSQAEIAADDFHKNGDFYVFVDGNGVEVARVKVLDTAVINTTAL